VARAAVADSSYVIAIANSGDRRHQDCLKVHKQSGRIYLPIVSITEIAYILRREVGSAAVPRFIHGLAASKYQVVVLNESDLSRVADLLIHYADSRLDFVDLSVAAVAERLELGTILTLDRRDFQIVRPRHRDRFMLLPEP
jgi:predicted nucleic acid-binding protein